MERPLVFYHGNSCPDGFGAAYAAWKKFGDAAEYHPLSRGEAPPYELVEGAEAYFLDFSYEKEAMMRLAASAKRMVALDHHEGVADATRSVPESVFDAERSGAGIAWDYFHPGVPRPKLIDHVEDDDLFRFAIPDTREIITYLEVQPQEFELWDDIASKLDDPVEREALLVRARTYREYYEILANISIDHARLVSFEGYEVLFATSHPLKSLRSYIGNQLAKKQPPLGLVVSAHPNGYGVSIRGDGSVNVAGIASRFGGNGHLDSAGFLIPREGPFPWEIIEEDT